MLSHISRDTACTRSVSDAVGAGSLRIWLLSGWNASGMNAWNRPGPFPNGVVRGGERGGNDCRDPAGVVLQRARAQHVVHALLVRFDVAVQHRHVRAHAEPVRRAVNFEVAIAAALVVRDLPAHA